jgi:trimeric autotransporter adhesin
MFFTNSQAGCKSSVLKFALLSIFISLNLSSVNAQLSVSANKTATQLSSTIGGSGITISSPVLTCPALANGTFTVTPGTLLGGTTAFGINSGILLTTGRATAAAGSEGPLVSYNNGAAGYAPLATLAGATTYDACVLEFDMTSIGDTVSFNYQFGSEEYRNSVCGPYNDAFEFLISGPGITGSANMALVPGSTVPVAVNSVNNGVVGIYGTWSNCTAMGPGSPFTTGYYVDNTGGSFFTYRGYTRKFVAKHSVIPCSTYHLVLAIADASNGLYDSGVFIEAGSLTTSVISGVPTMCVGGTTSLSYPYSGGTWSSSSTAVATVGTTSGVVSGVSAGTATITYSLATGCYATYAVTVNAMSPITGTLSLCAGATSTLSNATAGGTWSSGTVGVATIGASTGIVGGVSGGTSTISYATPAGCAVSAIVTVNPTPGAISGPTNICTGSAATLTNPVAGGTWTSSSTAVATVGAGTGIVSGVAAGATVITYSIGSCYVTQTVTVGSVTGIIGAGGFCLGAMITLSDATAGGTWTSTTPAVATVTAGGVVTGVTAGTSIISYTVGSGCFATAIVTVNPLPSPITGIFGVCTGSSTTLSSATAGGTWSCSPTTVASIGSSTGVVGGVAGGVSTVTYTSAVGCMVTAPVTVNSVAPISGITTICSGTTETIADATTGGTWSSGTTSVATIGTTGVVYGVAGGTSVISYVSPAGCIAVATVTINPTPAAITGTGTICSGQTGVLSSISAGGTWSSSAPSVATIAASTGTVGGVSAGTTNITYTLPGGCTATAVETVSSVAPITGITTICSGTAETVADATAGGTWSSGTTSVATVGATGIINGVAGGTSVISYVSPAGCIAVATVTINPTPAAITGTGTICSGQTGVLSSISAGGTWSSSAPSVATIAASTGTVGGVSAGTTNITYTLPGGCSTTAVETVSTVAPIIGTGSICAGSVLSLSDATAGGTWSSSAATVATVDPLTGLVIGLSGGTVTISYTTAAGCTATVLATINTAPGAITGSGFVCLGTTGTLSNSVGGGVWSSSNTAVATIGGISGIVSGLSSGTSTITYALPSGCSVTTVVTVDIIASITGPASICAYGGTTTLSNIATGGTWTSGTPVVATVDAATGEVFGAAAGIANITYTTASGCTAHTQVTVNPLPNAIIGNPAVCVGNIGSLYDSTAGGTWSSGNSTIATINSSLGVYFGSSAGTVLISYTSVFGCTVSAPITINALPTITGSGNICPNAVTVLSASSPGGTWSCTSPAVATVDAATGAVTSLDSGKAVIVYTSPQGCMSAVTVTVYPVPAAIGGIPSICPGGTTTLFESTQGGTWSISNGNAQFTYSGSEVSGLHSGLDTVTYTSAHGCNTTLVLTVQPVPPAIIGPRSICEEYSTTLTNSATGGIWKSNADSVAVIDSVTGVITGVGPGVVTITYTAPTGCWDTVQFSVNGAPHIAFYVKPDACVGEHLPIALTKAGTTVNNYVWDFDGATIITANSNSAGPYKVMWTEPGTYVVKLDGQGTVLCPTLHVQDTIVIHKNPDATIQAPSVLNGKEGLFCVGDSVFFESAVFSSNNTYEWQPAHFFTQNNLNYAIGQIEFPRYVSLSVTSQYGCTATDSVFLNPNSCCTVILPNAFTPNGDGLNDVFRPVSLGKHVVHSFRVLNRWGQSVYESDQQQFGWDGNFNGVPQDADTYFYFITFDCNGKTTIQKGDVTLVR